MKYFIKSVFTILFISFLNNINAQFIQLGNKLVGAGYTGSPEQGTSVAISGDGNTAIVGAPFNSSDRGSVWIYAKTNGIWSQQAAFYGTGYSGSPEQGTSVAISGDGNTAIVGGPGNSSNRGSVWIFVRNSGVWSQQAALYGTGFVGESQQGSSVAISADGNTAIVGGPYDNNFIGASWIFTRQNGVWSQQGPKLVGTGAVRGILYNAAQGSSVSISADGNTAIIGGSYDNYDQGASWIFTRQNGIWSQQGPKLVGTGAVGNQIFQGHSVSISGDGNTAIVGGWYDRDLGASWIFTRQNGQWTQQGNKLVGYGTNGMSNQGYSVSISSDGNTAIVGGDGDGDNRGASWIFVRQNGHWTQKGNKLVGTGIAGGYAYQGSSVSLSADGNTAIVGGPGDNGSIGAAWIFTTYNTISATAGSGGTISPSGNVNVNYESNQTFTITPNTGYHILKVLIDGVSKGAINTYTFPNVTADHTISASFAIDQFTITSSAGEHGTISPSGNILVNYGQSQTYSFYPDQGYHVSDVIVDGTSKGSQPDYTFSNVVGSHTISVSFAPNLYIITSQAEPGGTITPTGNVEVPYGENQTFTITPNEGYHILDVVVSGVSKGAQSSYTFETVHENGSIIATFAINQYPITASSGNGGSISPPGTIYVNYHGSQTYTVTPNAGYHIQDVLIDGLSKGAINSYTFSDVVGEHTISASFAIDQFTIGNFVWNDLDNNGIQDLGEPGISLVVVELYDCNDNLISTTVTDISGYYSFNNLTAGSYYIRVSLPGGYVFTLPHQGGNDALDSDVNPADGKTACVAFAAGVNNLTFDAGMYVLPPQPASLGDFVWNDTNHNGIQDSGEAGIANVVVDLYDCNNWIVTTTLTDATGHYLFINLAPGSYYVEFHLPTGYTFTAKDAGANDALDSDADLTTGKTGCYTLAAGDNNTTVDAGIYVPPPAHVSITSSAGEGGTISPLGNVMVNYGENQEFIITPATGYHVLDVVVDGQSKGGATSYLFETVVANHTITASFAINTFKVTSSSGEGGTITPLGEITLNYGQSQTYTITPNAGYKIYNVLLDGNSIGAPSSYTISDIKGDHTISATFEIEQFTITSSSSAHGTIDPSGNVPVGKGQNKTFNFYPADGYHVSSVIVDNAEVPDPQQSYTFTDVQSDHSIIVSFAQTVFSISATQSEGGTIAPPGVTTVPFGQSQTYTMTPNPGYHILKVLADNQQVTTVPGSGGSESYTFTDVTGNHTITAEFAVYTYKITSSSGENGTITPLGETTLNWGAGQTYTITPSQGYHVLDVKVDGTSLGAKSSYTFSDIKADHSISATFAHTTYSIMATAESGGIITPSGNIAVNEADTKSFTITPSQGYHIADVVVDEQSKGAITGYTFTDIHENHTISATFSIDQFTITASQSEHGKVTPEGVTNVSSGGTQTYSITPDQGYKVLDVLADNQSVGAVTSYTFTNVTGNHTITASFAIMTYKITSTSGSNGTITPSGEVNVNYGSSQEYTITPSSGYHIMDVIVDGQSKGAVSTYKFENVSSDHTISAQFEMDTPEELPVPVAVSPKAGVILYTNTPTLYWSAGVNITGLSYRVKYSTDPGNTNQNGDMKIIDAGSSTSYILPQLQWGKTYYWQVQSVKGSASSDYSAIESFKVVEEQVVVNPEVPIPAWPLSGSTVYLSSTTLTWYLLSGWSNIVSYTLRWGESGGSLNNVVDGITSMTYFITGLLPGHSYSWRVESVDRYGNHSLPSDVQSFTTAGGTSNKPYTPTQAWPVGGAIVYVTSPTLSWYMLQPGFGIKEYLVRYSKNPDMSQSVEIHLSGLLNVITLTGLEKGMTYYWQVQSYDGYVYSEPQTPPASFTVYTDWLTAGYTPMALSPSGGIVLSTSSVQLSWASLSSGEANSYNLQYSTNKDFTNPVEVKHISDTYFKTDKLNNSTYYWRVQSQIQGGITSSYSPAGKFTVKTVTGVMSDNLNAHEFSLLQNYPNPFNPTTSIVFNLPKESDVTVEVFDGIGKFVSQLFKGQKPKGITTLEFNAEDLPSGIYFYKIIALDTNGNMNYAIKKMIILK